MFTGIVEERGRVRALERRPAGMRLSVSCRAVLPDSDVGASVSVSGVCLTVVERDEEGLSFDLAAETLARSTLGDLSPGDPVNLERPVTLSTRLGGHLVQGHVDGVGEVLAVEPDGTLRVALPDDLERYVVEKGSVTVDGVSLTVAATHDHRFDAALVPHTLAVTSLGERRPGDRVNLEVDIVSKYLEKLARRDG
ncbi:MAG TPA: riboflavin synthase [Actinomycetota bacterium]